MAFDVNMHTKALDDILNAFEYYNEQQKGLGKRFVREVDKGVLAISKNPFYQIRYDDIRCFPLSKFPFMIHFVLNEKENMIEIYAVIHTSLNPETNWLNR